LPASGGAPKTRYSGKQAYTEWLKLLNAGIGCDNNMLIHLRYNRTCAVAYLRDMASRYTGSIADHLNAAADLYQRELDDLLATPLPTSAGPGGRPAYTAMVERAFQLETQAVAELQAPHSRCGDTKHPDLRTRFLDKTSPPRAVGASGSE
jgi:hypothetical protein